MTVLPKTTPFHWLRTGLCIALLGGIAWAIGRSLLVSQIGAPAAVDPMTFPAELPLANWQWVGSQELSERSLKSVTQIISSPSTAPATNGIPVLAQVPVSGGRSYQYRQGDRTLHIEARALSNTQGHVPDLLAFHPTGAYAAAQPPITLRTQPQVGAYGMFAIAGTPYLSSCINPQGEATFTRQQFVNHHLRADLTPNHLWRWLLNQAEIPDRRCVWVYMWMAGPPDPNAPQTLEATWLSWYQTWRSPRP